MYGISKDKIRFYQNCPALSEVAVRIAAIDPISLGSKLISTLLVEPPETTVFFPTVKSLWFT